MTVFRTDPWLEQPKQSWWNRLLFGANEAIGIPEPTVKLVTDTNALARRFARRIMNAIDGQPSKQVVQTIITQEIAAAVREALRDQQE